MNENRYYGVRVAGAKYGVGFGSALAIAISYANNHSILWAIIHGILGWLYVIYFALCKEHASERRPDDLSSSGQIAMPFAAMTARAIPSAQIGILIPGTGVPFGVES